MRKLLVLSFLVLYFSSKETVNSNTRMMTSCNEHNLDEITKYVIECMDNDNDFYECRDIIEDIFCNHKENMLTNN